MSVAKRENNPRRIDEVVLIVCSGEYIAEPRHHVVHLSRPDLNKVVHRYIEPQACLQSEGFCRRFFLDRASSHNWLTELRESIPIHVGMRAAEQYMCVGLELRRSDLQLRTDHVGEQVPLDVARQAIGKARVRRNVKRRPIAAAALHICLDPEVFIDVEGD